MNKSETGIRHTICYQTRMFGVYCTLGKGAEWPSPRSQTPEQWLRQSRLINSLNEMHSTISMHFVKNHLEREIKRINKCH